MIAFIVGSLTGLVVSFTVGSLICGGRRIFLSYAICLVGTVVDVTPRRYLPDGILRWYHGALERWEPSNNRT